jgi:Mrp family chromosome partitioning ATPase
MVARAFGTAPRTGIVELIKGEVDIQTAVTPDPESGLDMILVKQSTHYPQALLGSPAMAALLRSLERIYDRIIIDSPPVLAVSDSTALARLASTVLLVVRWNDTTYAALETALKRLRAARANVAGAVLTQVSPRGAEEFARRTYGPLRREVAGYYAR